MNFDVMNSNIGFCETVFDASAEQSVDADISLPDYCPDIQRILKCTVDTSVTNVTTGQGRITADASAAVRILYVGTEGKISAYEQSYPFQKYVESGSIDRGCAVSVRARADYVNCRAVSPRRVDVHAALSCLFKADKRRSEEILSGAQGAGLQCKSKSFETIDIVGKTVRSFPMSEVVELAAGRPAAAQIVNASACARSDDIKVISNKLLLKGTLDISVYYVGDSGGIEPFEHSMPISQIIELDGLTEDCLCNLEMNVAALEVLPKVDSSGVMKLLDISASIEAVLSACRPVNAEFISDVYSTEYEVNTESRSVEICRYLDAFSTTWVNKSSVECQGAAVDCALALWCSEPVYNVSVNDLNCVVSGSYECSVVYRDADGELGFLQKQIDFEYKNRLAAGAERIRSNSSVKIIACSCAVTADSRLEIKAELLITASVFTTGIEKYISSISVNETAVKSKSTCALTIYFSDPGESVWSIAKKYNTTARAIMDENSIASDRLENGGMILIPSA